MRSPNDNTDTDFHMEGSRLFRRRWYLAIWFASISGSNLIWSDRSNSAFASNANEPLPASFNLDEYLAVIASLHPHSILNPSAIDLDLIADRFNPSRILIPSSILIVPKVVPKDRVQPITTTWIFNGIPVNHLTSQEFKLGSESGSSRNSLQSLNSILYHLHSKLK